MAGDGAGDPARVVDPEQGAAGGARAPAGLVLSWPALSWPVLSWLGLEVGREMLRVPF